MRKLVLALALLVTLLPTGAQATAWGTLQVMAEREWTTEKEPRPRITKFRWVTPGKVLEARHGFVSRLQFGEAKFADTVQRFVIDPKTNIINVTYTYEDGRPPLKAVIKVQPDGSLIETFTDAKGVKKRNIYKSPSLSLNAIERQEMKGGTWVSLGTTRKAGLTQVEIAENKRRAEAARQMAVAQENAYRAAEQARRAAEEARQEAAYEQQQYEQQPMQQGMGYNMLDVLNGLGNSIAQENQRQQQAFDQQMRANQAEQARQRAADAQAAADAAAARANSQSYASGSSSGGGGSYGGGGSQVIANDYAGSGFDLVASGSRGDGSAPSSPAPTQSSDSSCTHWREATDIMGNKVVNCADASKVTPQ